MNIRQNSIVSSKRLGDLLTDVEEKRLIVRPQFQRRLVWNNVVKDKFLDTVLNRYPFPEIFVAVGELDPTKLKRTQWLVDGQQRISTLRQYVLGEESLVLKKVKPYAKLSPDEKQAFSDYPVAVRDLGTVSEDEIKEIFSRINSTDYSLKAIERLNALFSGPFKTFCEKLATHTFFNTHRVFTMTDLRRMRDLDFCVILVITLLSTYFHRDEKNREYLQRYNDEFGDADNILKRIESVFTFLEKCRLGPTSRAWKKTNLLTLLVELDAIINRSKKRIDSSVVGPRLSKFYNEVDALFKQPADSPARSKSAADVANYLKAATKATNDKYARDARAEIVSRVILGSSGRAKK
ncbi:MAG TPA: DUF262 domain-containing protein [Tepidisphaeraceae bacterium]|jgi:hypothetical protein|nr:DUF262 domain-containing protein [Tepidisphaeraceae bacterium]